jgi:hypothetical protein
MLSLNIRIDTNNFNKAERVYFFVVKGPAADGTAIPQP